MIGKFPKVGPIVSGVVAEVAPSNTVAPTVSPSGTQSTGTVITANVGTWSGTPTITYAYRWTRNGSPISGATASTYTIQVADDGTTIRCEVQGSNAFGTSAFVASSNSVSAVNAVAPVNTVAPVISGSTTLGSTLTTTDGTWTGIPTPTYSYQWFRGATPIGTNQNTYITTLADSEQNITCRVTATNTAGSANSTSNAITLPNYAPINTVAPVISGSTTLGSTLSTTNGTWSNSPASFAYQWKRNGSNIGGATSSTYVTTLADSTANITCDVTATNTAGSATAGSNTITLPSYAPVNTVLPVVSGTAVVGQTLSTTNGTWTNSPSTFAYQWFRGATLISGATNSTYTLVAADAGNTSNITCDVTATNSAGSANATSNTIAQILTVRTNAFMVASGISDATIRGALNTLDVGLISNSLDTKMVALYPFVGGTASTHRWNFMDARDLDAAYRLVFNGTVSHTANGMQSNGVNGFADTFLTPNTALNVNSHGLGYYGTQYTVNAGDPVAMGTVNGGTQRAIIITTPTTLSSGLNGTVISSSIPNGNGSFDTQKTSATVTRIYRNGTLLNTGNSGGTLPTLKIFIGTISIAGNVAYSAGFTNIQFRLAYISNGLNDTEVSNLRTLVQDFQITLGRSL